MSDFSFNFNYNNESNSGDQSYIRFDNSLNVLECTFDINTNKISAAETCPDYNNVSGSFKGLEMSSVSGAYCTDYSTITKYKNIDLAFTTYAEDVNESVINFSNLSCIDNSFITSYSKGVDLKCSTYPQFENNARMNNSLYSKSYNVDSSLDIPEPKKPFISMQNCFNVSKACGYSLKTYELINRIEIALNEKVEMSFEFDQKNVMWNAVYIKGSAHCKFQVHVYSDNESLLMEIHKLSGDSITFHSIARDIKNSVFGVKEEYAESMCPVSSSIQPCDVLSDADAFAAIELFQEMAAAPFRSISDNPVPKKPFITMQNCFDVSGAYCTDYSTITKCKGIDLAVTIQAEDVNIDSVCPNFFFTSNYKGIDLKSSTCSLLEDSTQLTNSLNSESYNVDSSLDIPVPKKSFITMQNCFDVSKACGYSLKTYELINRIKIALSEKVEMSYEFDQKYFMWNAVYIKGSAHCKFTVHIYSDNESLLMGIHKLSGDSITFHSISRDIKNSVVGVKEESAELMCPFSSSIQPCDVLSDADAFVPMEVYQEIMVTEPFDESQFEVCHILDDLSPPQ